MERCLQVASWREPVYSRGMKTIGCALLLLLLGIVALLAILSLLALVVLAMAKISPLLGFAVFIACTAWARTFTDWKPRGFLE